MSTNGTIKKLTKDRRFGFIRGEDGVEYFFHASELRGAIVFEDLREGQRVIFQAVAAEKGPRASDIHAA